MSKILSATADATGKVTAEGQLVPAAVVLSQGKQASSGLLIIEGDKAWYLVGMSVTDLVTTIEKSIKILDDLGPALTQITTILTSIGAGTGPTTAPPPTLAADVLQVTAKVTALNATKSELTTLKGALK